VGASQNDGASGRIIMVLRSQKGWMGRADDSEARFGSNDEKMSVNIKIWRGRC